MVLSERGGTVIPMHGEVRSCPSVRSRGGEPPDAETVCIDALVLDANKESTDLKGRHCLIPSEKNFPLLLSSSPFTYGILSATDGHQWGYSLNCVVGQPCKAIAMQVGVKFSVEDRFEMVRPAFKVGDSFNGFIEVIQDQANVGNLRA
jgi:hypothetical protein